MVMCVSWRGMLMRLGVCSCRVVVDVLDWLRRSLLLGLAESRCSAKQDKD